MTDEIMQFPCVFPIKVMGKQSNQFQHMVESLVREHVADEDWISIQSAQSRKGNYLSVTVKIQAQSRQQLDAIYLKLTGCKEVIMAL